MYSQIQKFDYSSYFLPLVRLVVFRHESTSRSHELSFFGMSWQDLLLRLSDVHTSISSFQFLWDSSLVRCTRNSIGVTVSPAFTSCTSLVTRLSEHSFFPFSSFRLAVELALPPIYWVSVCCLSCCRFICETDIFYFSLLSISLDEFYVSKF